MAGQEDGVPESAGVSKWGFLYKYVTPCMECSEWLCGATYWDKKTLVIKTFGNK